MVNLSRRGFFGIGAAGALAAGCVTGKSQHWAKAPAETNVSFDHGVAAGDATSNSVILWTRATPASDTAGFDVLCEVATDRAAFENRAARSADASIPSVVISTSADRDYTVKVDFGAGETAPLQPATTYFYQFVVTDAEGEKVSPIGSFKTLPAEGRAAFKAAFVSCSNFPFGYFNAYEAIAKRDDVDALIHLGDYIYEYGRDGYGAEVGAQLGREVEPAHEIVKLEDYRQRYAQYRSDPSLQAAHAACAWYLSWDDHESTNDSYRNGAQNHQPDTEGEWSVRKAKAVQAYLEWMPVRDPQPGRAVESIYRKFEIGDLATLFMLESRLTGRSDELSYDAAFEAPEAERMNVVMATLGAAKSEERTMLGMEQEAWLEDGLKASVESGKTWQILGNQVIMARVNAPNIADVLTAEQKEAIYARAPFAKSYIEFSRFGLPLNLDAWDGFDAARERLYLAAESAGAKLVTLTGDTHTAWANELHDKNGTQRGVEFGCTSVTSPGLGSLLPVPEINEMMAAKNADVTFYDAFGNGFTLLTIAEDKVAADYIKVSTVLSPEYDVEQTAHFEATATETGVSKLTKG